jgi:hypothetical protein
VCADLSTIVVKHQVAIMAKRPSDDDINNSSVNLKSGSKVHITLRYKQSRRRESSVQRGLTLTKVSTDSSSDETLSSLSPGPTDQETPNTFDLGQVDEEATAGLQCTLAPELGNVNEAASAEQQNMIDGSSWRISKLPQRRLPNEYVAQRNEEAAQLCRCEKCLASNHPCYKAQLLLLERENYSRRVSEWERRMEEEERQRKMKALKNDQDYQRQLAALEAQNKSRIMMKNQQTEGGIQYGTMAPKMSPSQLRERAQQLQSKLSELKQDATKKISALEQDLWGDRRRRSAQSRAQIERELACLQEGITEQEIKNREDHSIKVSAQCVKRMQRPN